MRLFSVPRPFFQLSSKVAFGAFGAAGYGAGSTNGALAGHGLLDQDLWTPDSGSTLSRRAIPSLVVASSLAEACERPRAASSCAVTDPAGAGAAPACALLCFCLVEQ